MIIETRVQNLLFVILIVFVAVKAWRPTSPSILHEYLGNSRWTLSKTIEYGRGGCSGTFRGDALFENIGQEKSLLHYTEHGIAELLNGNTVSARHKLLYKFEDDAIVSVYFIDDPYDDNEQMNAETILRRGRFFHHIRFDETSHNEPVLSPHPCGPDMYHGRLHFATSDLFTLHWKVTGPRKEGNIVSSYTRKT